MSFQIPAMKDAPLSEVTTDGTPMRLTQPWRKAEAAASEVASDIGIACKFLVVRQMAVNRYL